MRSCWPVLLLALAAAKPAPRPVHASDFAQEAAVREWLASRPAPAAAPAPDGFSEADREGLKDSVSSARPPLRDLPGLSPDPFDVCRTLERCWPLPTSFHVEARPLVSDAVAALLRPWIALGKARGWKFSFAPAGASPALLTARLDGLPRTALTIASAPVRTGGYDVWLESADGAPELFERERVATVGPRY